MFNDDLLVREIFFSVRNIPYFGEHGKDSIGTD